MKNARLSSGAKGHGFWRRPINYYMKTIAADVDPCLAVIVAEVKRGLVALRGERAPTTLAYPVKRVTDIGTLAYYNGPLNVVTGSEAVVALKRRLTCGVAKYLTFNLDTKRVVALITDRKTKNFHSNLLSL